MTKVFNIFEKIESEILDFDRGGVYIVGRPDGAKYESSKRRGERGGYYHSQKDLLDAIDLASASKFKTGIWDEEGQRKTFLNIVNFYRDLMKMKININVSNYILKPTNPAYTWAVWVFNKTFKLWATQNDYDDRIDEFAHDLASYGSTVAKKAGECVDRVPLRTMRVTQTAKSLYNAAAYGGYVLLENDFHYNQMKIYPDWILDDIDKTKNYCTYERYGLVPQGLADSWGELTALEIAGYEMKKDEEMVLAMAVAVLEGADTKSGSGQSLLFLEIFDEDSWPLEECHTERIDGRWIGRGEIEKQLENQIARNVNANYRRRGILWSARKLFQSTDSDIQQNLVYEASDGEVLHVKPNGQITQINTQSQHLNDISTDDNTVKESSQQMAFAFEVATGESLPSKTPFRLGVILSNAVSQHFTLVRETFANFLRRSFFDQIVPLCKEEFKEEHDVIVPLLGPDMEAFREEIIVYHTNVRIWNEVANGEGMPDAAKVRAQVEQELARNEYAFIQADAGFYEHAEAYMELNLTTDISADISDLTTLYQAMVQRGDPRAEKVLQEIFALRGKALPAIIGPAPTQTTPVANETTSANDTATPVPSPLQSSQGANVAA